MDCMTITILLLEPEKPGNLGAVARVMANFNFKDLVLINPKCNKNDQEARNRAKHAQSILKNAKVKPKSFLKTFDYLVATTSKLGTDYNIPRSPVTPEQLTNLLKTKNQKAKVGILFGRESSGLTNKEILDCDFSVTIPTDKQYSALNLSHSVAIILYELNKLQTTNQLLKNYTPAKKKELEITQDCLEQILKKLPFKTKENIRTQRIVWKRFLGKAMLTRRELFAVIGLFKKILKKL